MDEAVASDGGSSLAVLVVLATCVLSLEILRNLLAARLLAAVAMAVAWLFLLPAPTQVRALCCAVASHLAVEGVAQWRADFPVVFDKSKDRRVILWLLFWGRVFVWGATVGALAGLMPSHSSRQQEGTAAVAGRTIAGAMYCETIEVLLLLYFSTDAGLPYRWRKRVVNWGATLGLNYLEASRGWPSWLAGVSPVAVLGMLLVFMAASINIPWHELADRVAPLEDRLDEDDDEEEDLKHQSQHRWAGMSGIHTSEFYEDLGDEESSEETALETGSEEDGDLRQRS